MIIAHVRQTTAVIIIGNRVQKRSCDFTTDRSTRQQFVKYSEFRPEFYRAECAKSRERVKTTCHVYTTVGNNLSFDLQH